MTQSAVDTFRQFRRFEIVSRLGSGSGGEVFEAIDRERHARVALKALGSPTPEMIRALKREFRSVQDIQHENLVRLGELFEEDGQWFFTMEFIQGVDFLQYVSLSGHEARNSAAPISGRNSRAHAARCDEAKLRASLLQLVRGLSALHAAGKIHRDIKPSNILVTREGRVVIIDFGAMLDTDNGQLSEEGAVIGTPLYMSPEQSAGEEASAPADWYGVGGILFHALTGTLPFLGSMGEILEKKISREAPPPSQFAANLPSDLEDLCVELLRCEPESRPVGPDILRRLTGEVPANDTRPLTPSRAFVGRRRELAELADASAAVASGGTVAFFVHGESGVGKSALIRTFTDRLIASSAEPIVLLRGRCYERESVPFKGVDGLIDSLSQFLLERDSDEVEKLLPDGFDLLCRAFPVLADVSPGHTESTGAAQILNPNEQRARLFTAARELLLRVGARFQLVLLVDDLQWTDSDSLALLLEVLRAPRAPRLLFVASMRVGTQRSTGGRLADEQIKRIGGDVRHLYVERLPSSDAEELVSFLLGDGVNTSAEDIRSIASEAAGHPLFIDELVRQRALHSSSPGPMRLDDALWERVIRLDAQSRRLLEVVVVAGAPIQQEKASHAAGMDSATLFVSASTLRNAHMIAAGGVRSDDHLEAYHDRVRESVLAHLDETARKATHARIAVAEEQSKLPDAEALATHWDGAGNAARAAEYAVVAGDRASHGLAFSRAVHWYQRALDLSPPLGEAGSPLRKKLAEALTSDGREAEAAEVRLEISKYAEPVEALDLRRHAAEQFLQSGHFEQGYVLLRAVLAEVGERFPLSPLAVVFWVIVSRLRLRVRGLAYKERDPAELERRALVRIDSVWSAGTGFAMTDNIRGAYFQTNNLLLALNAGDPQRIARALAMEVCFTSAGGSKKKALTHELLAAATKVSEQVGTPYALALARFAAGYTRYMNGEWSDSKREFTDAEERFRDHCVGVNWLLSSTRTMLYRTLVLSGELRELSDRIPPVLRTAVERGDTYAVLNLRAIPMTMIHLAADRPDAALENINQLLEMLPKGVFHIQHYFVLLASLECDIYSGAAPRGLKRLEASAAAMKRSLLLRVEAVRVLMIDQEGRCAPAAAAQTPSAPPPALVAAAQAKAVELGRVNSPWAQALGIALGAGVSALRADRAATISELDRAGKALTAVDMQLHAAAIQRRHGQLTGGAIGIAQVAEAEAAMDKLGVQNHEAMTRLYTPGVELLLGPC